jgi:RNA polymerase sigma factor (sigma-70 family)
VTISDSPPDHLLLMAARRGERDAFARLVERHYPTLLACCSRLVRDGELAREAAQEAVLRAMLGLDRLRDEERFGAWLVGIGLNVCRSLLTARERRARTEPEPAEQLAPDADPIAELEAGELAARIRSAIAELPAGQREAVALFYLAGLTHAEIAEEVGSRPGAIKTRLHKARRSLRASLHDLREEPAPMRTESPDLIPMRVSEVRRTAPGDHTAPRHVVFLEDSAGARRLPIWVGEPEAVALAIQLEQVELPRPAAYHFASSLLCAAGSGLAEVRITELTDSTFYAQAILSGGAVVDARPSDALALALVTGAPIYVRQAVLDQSESQHEAHSELIEEAERATDDTRTLAEEVRGRLRSMAEELAALRRRCA